ncbi:MAG: M67 family metallopeptidase [Deltaproteobacteria bacterium]|nr:M67 family metallopeptidase [Deltaproteobacteria bacterium]
MQMFQISQELLDQCFAHGAQAFPEEACGVLTGPGDRPETLDGFHPFDNKLGKLHALDPERYPRDATDGYHMDPLAYLKLEKAQTAQGRRVKVIYHTHPNVGAYFSEEDTQQALWDGRPRHPEVVYLVCGVKDHQPDGAIWAWFNPETGGFTTQPALPV